MADAEKRWPAGPAQGPAHERVGMVNAGDHACLTFSEAEERLDLVAAFIREGLRRGQKVVCWTDSLSPDGMATQLSRRLVRPGAALRRGQLTISTAGDTLLSAAGAGASTMVAAL